MNIEKQVAYWLKSAQEDWDASRRLIQSEMYRHGLFFVHLAVEKALKAVYSKRLAKVPPKIHNLDKLVELCGLVLNEEQAATLSVVNTFNIEGRYPETLPVIIDKSHALDAMERAQGVYQWLIKQL